MTIAEVKKHECTAFQCCVLKATVAKVTGEVAYSNSSGQARKMFKAALVDHSGHITATIYNPALKPIVQEGFHVVIRNFCYYTLSLLIIALLF